MPRGAHSPTPLSGPNRPHLYSSSSCIGFSVDSTWLTPGFRADAGWSAHTCCSRNLVRDRNPRRFRGRTRPCGDTGTGEPGRDCCHFCRFLRRAFGTLFSSAEALWSQWNLRTCRSGGPYWTCGGRGAALGRGAVLNRTEHHPGLPGQFADLVEHVATCGSCGTRGTCGPYGACWTEAPVHSAVSWPWIQTVREDRACSLGWGMMTPGETLRSLRACDHRRPYLRHRRLRRNGGWGGRGRVNASVVHGSPVFSPSFRVACEGARSLGSNYSWSLSTKVCPAPRILPCVFPE